MMEKLRKISTMYYVKQILACLLVCYMLFGIPVQVALAVSPGDVVDIPAGLVDFPVSPPGTTIVNVLSNKAIINWSNFDTVPGEFINFLRGTDFAVLNRVVAGEDPTNFLGTLNAPLGNVFLINSRGIMFGPTSFINARNFVASGLGIRDLDFINGDIVNPDNINYRFGYGNRLGLGDLKSVTVDTIGDVTLSGAEIDAETIALIGKSVLNQGTIRTTTGGAVIMAAGETVLLSEVGSDVVVSVGMTDPAEHTVENTGTIEASSGNVGKVVLAAGDIFSTAISGVDSLAAVANRDIELNGDFEVGEITLTADYDGVDGGDVIVNDTLTTTTGDIEISASDNTIYLYGDYINAAGSVLLNNTTESYGDIIAGQDVTMNGTLELKGTGSDADQEITATNGSLYANEWVHKTSTGKLDMFGGHNGDDLSVKTKEVKVDDGDTNGELTITGNAWVKLDGDIYSRGDMTLASNVDADKAGPQAGFMDHDSGTIQSLNGDIDISASNCWIHLSGGNPTEYVKAEGDILLRDGTYIYGHGQGGRKLDAGDDVVLAAAGNHLEFYGYGAALTVEAGDDIIFGVTDVATHETTQAVGSAWKVTSDGDLILTAGDDIYAHGTLIAGGNITATAVDNINLYKTPTSADAGGTLTLKADADLQYGGDVIAKGAITAEGDVDIAGNLIKLYEDVRANGGDLTITGRTSEDWDFGELMMMSVNGSEGYWGYIDVAEGKTLYASHDVILIDAFGSGGYDEPPAGKMDLFGHGSLTIEAAGGEITTEGPWGPDGVKITVKDTLPPTSLTMKQADPLNLVDYTFGNQNNTDLTLVSYNGSVAAVDSQQFFTMGFMGKNENAADQWASIGATAFTDVALQGHDVERDITAMALTSNATDPYTGNINVISNNRKVFVTENVIATNGSISLTAINPTNGGIEAGGNILARDGITLWGEVTADAGVAQTFDAGQGTLWAKDTISPITKTGDGGLTLAGDTLVDLDGISGIGDSVWVQAGPLTIEDSLDVEGNLKAQGIIHLQGTTNNVAGDILSTGSGIIFDYDVTADGVGSQEFDAGSGKLVAENGADIDKSTAGSLTLAGDDGIELGGNVTGTGMESGDSIVFENNVTADGTGDAEDQRFDAGLGALDADMSIAKTTDGKLNLGGDEGIELGGNVETHDGDLTFEDAVTANGIGDQRFDAGTAWHSWGNDLVAEEDIIKTTDGSLTLDGGRGDVDSEIYLAGNVETHDGDLIFEDKVVANGTDAHANQRIESVNGLLIAEKNIDKSTSGNMTLAGDDGITLSGDVTGSGLASSDTITFEDDVTANGTGGQRFDAYAGTLDADGHINKTTDGSLNLGGNSGIVLGGDATTSNGDLTLEDAVTADGTGLYWQRLIAGGTGKLTANASVHKTSTGTLLMVGGFDGPLGSGDYSVSTKEVRVEDGELAITGNAFVLLDGDIYSKELLNLTSNDDGDEIGPDAGTLEHASGTIKSLNNDVKIDAINSRILLNGGVSYDPINPDTTTYVTAGGDILLYASTSIAADRKLDAGDDVVLAADKRIVSNGNLTIEAGDDIILGSADVDNHWDDPTDGSPGNVTVDGDLTLNAEDSVYAHGSLTSTGDITISSSDSTTYLLGDLVEAAGNVNLNNNTEAADGILIHAVNGDVVVGVETEQVNPDDYPGMPGLIPGVYTETSLYGYGDLNVQAGSDVIVGGDLGSDGAGALDVKAVDNIAVGNASSNRNMDMTADNGNITIGNLKRVYDLEPVSIALELLNGDLEEVGDLVYFGGNVNTYGGNMTLTATNGGISFKSAGYSSGNMNMTAGQDIAAGVIAPAVRVKGNLLDEVVTITQGGNISSSGDMTLLADNDIKAKWAGSGGQMLMDAGHDILIGGVFPTLAANVYDSDGYNMGSRFFGTTAEDVLNVSKAGGVWANGDLTMLAGNDIKLKMAEAQNGNILMTAGQDILVGGLAPHAVEIGEDEYGTAEFDKGGYLTAYNGAMTLSAERDISLKMADAEYDITMTAGQNLTLRTNSINPGSDPRDDRMESDTGDIRLHALNGDISIAEGYELIAGDFSPGYQSDGWVDAEGGGVSVIADNGKIFSPGGDDDTLNIYVEGSSVQADDIGVKLPEDETKKAAIVIISKDDLKLGTGSELIAEGMYLPTLGDGDDVGDGYAGTDDRAAIGLLDDGDPLTATIGGVLRDEGEPIDVAIYLASTEGDVDFSGSVSIMSNPRVNGLRDVSVNGNGEEPEFEPQGTMVIDAYDTVTLGEFGETPEAEVETVEQQGRFINVDRLEVVSRITEWLFQAVGRLPFVYDPAAIAAFEDFIGGDYILRGAGLDNPAITDGRAWVLEDPSPPAPLYEEAGQAVERLTLGLAGCPVLVAAASAELGIPSDTIQVSLANSFALNTNIQPCDSCARLLNAAEILSDEDGSGMAALNQVFNELAPAGAPFTPEVAASIVTAFAGRVNDGTQYATAIEYIDALVRYIAVLDAEMGSPVGDGDSVAFIMEKYGTGITSSDNSNIAAFVATRLESGETFGE